MVGQAQRDKELAVELSRTRAEDKAEQRRQVFGAIFNTFFDVPQNIAQPNSTGGDRFLKKDGDIMRGGIEHTITVFTINTGLIGSSNGLINENRIILRGEGGVDDDALAMIFPKFGKDMIVYISNEPGFGDITLLNDIASGGNFRLTGDNDLLLTAGKIHTLWFDSLNDLWREISARDPTGGAGTEVFTWTNNHSAANFSLTSLKTLFFQTGGGLINGNVTGIDHDVSSGLTHDFAVASNLVVSISSAGLTNVGNIAIINGGISASDSLTTSGNITLGSTITFNNGNTISGGAGGLDYDVPSGVDHTFSINSSAQMAISAAGTTFVNNIAIINGGVSSSDFLTTSGNITTSGGSIVLASVAVPLSGSNVGWTGTGGDIFGNIESNDSYFFRENGSTIVEMDHDGVDIRTGWLELTEITPPGGLTNHARLYLDDSGGTSRLRVNIGGVITTLATS